MCFIFSLKHVWVFSPHLASPALCLHLGLTPPCVLWHASILPWVLLFTLSVLFLDEVVLRGGGMCDRGPGEPSMLPVSSRHRPVDGRGRKSADRMGAGSSNPLCSSSHVFQQLQESA